MVINSRSKARQNNKEIEQYNVEQIAHQFTASSGQH